MAIQLWFPKEPLYLFLCSPSVLPCTFLLTETCNKMRINFGEKRCFGAVLLVVGGVYNSFLLALS